MKLEGFFEVPRTAEIYEYVIAELGEEMWAKLYPRRYDETGPHSYDTPKAVSYAMLDGIVNFAKAPHDKGEDGRLLATTQQVEALWASAMAQYKVPTYYMARDLSEALLKTTPAGEIDWTTMKLPFEAAAFMLPKGVLHHSGEHADVSFVSYSRHFQGQFVDIPKPGGKWEFDIGNDNFNLIARLANGVTMHWTIDRTFSAIDFKQSVEMMEMARTNTHLNVFNSDTVLNEGDEQMMAQVMKLLFNIVLFMTSKPEMVEAAHLLKRVKQRDRKVEYWRPHIIGRSYKLRYVRAPGDGHHASPRGHWVSGFWREQAYGERHSLRRSMWIEPFWRGGDA